MDRGERRRRTANIVIRRHRQWIEWGREHWGNVPGQWKKLSCSCCGCSKRQRGRPKVANGLCRIGERHYIYLARSEVRELKRLVGNGEDLDSDRVARVTHPRPWRRRGC